SRRPRTRFSRDWSSDVWSSDLAEGNAVFIRPRAYGGEIAVEIPGPGIVLGRRCHASRQGILDHIRVAIGIDLAVIDICGHVQHLLHGRALPAALCQLGYI